MTWNPAVLRQGRPRLPRRRALVVYQSLEVSHRAYVLETGRVVLSGRQLLDDERVEKAFLGM
ncbi:MAG TPA: hypothetical protein VFF02_10990 [Anaeromyxobacteraceae bacterium]|nr:hypothetical protein [Anaeromyxobacteraceae bacterium]